MDSLSLFENRSQRVLFLFFLSTLFLFNIFLHYQNYKEFTKNEIIQLDATVVNIYPKTSYNVLKLHSEDLTFFTSVSKEFIPSKLQKINLYLITQKLTFFEYLKGFYVNSFNHHLLPNQPTIQTNIYTYIINQHENPHMQSLFSALFLATNITPQLREFTSNYSIAHLIAISGFHLGVLSALLYFLINLIYKPIHQNYLPYRNKKFDILLFTSVILFGYLYLLDFVPSLLRAFVMLIFGLIMLRSNIKLLSFETLFIIVLFILALFPKLLFSLSLWFSVTGVFYIFLYLHYFKNQNKYFQIFFFNIWIFLAMNPIIHFFFPITSLEQFYSPFISYLFTLFYPLVALLHFFEYGYILDTLLLKWVSLPVQSWQRDTSLEFFLFYIFISLLAIISKKSFIVLNILLILFTLYLFQFSNF